MVETDPPAPENPEPRLEGIERPVEIRSEDLLRGQRELRIVHEGTIYRLTLTRNGKLLLTK